MVRCVFFPTNVLRRPSISITASLLRGATSVHSTSLGAQHGGGWLSRSRNRLFAPAEVGWIALVPNHPWRCAAGRWRWLWVVQCRSLISMNMIFFSLWTCKMRQNDVFLQYVFLIVFTKTHYRNHDTIQNPFRTRSFNVVSILPPATRWCTRFMATFGWALPGGTPPTCPRGAAWTCAYRLKVLW